MGLAYVKCKLDKPSDLLSNDNVDVVEDSTEDYYLLLPFMCKATLTTKYAAILGDWDVGDESTWRSWMYMYWCDICGGFGTI